jgi:PadR family transcriptional regulator, regulatory protein AphA
LNISPIRSNVNGIDRLTTTSYALLGQLALRPWSVYDMTQNVLRTLRFFWPRAESVLYAEVKRLERMGLASRAQEQGARGRPRTVYTITAEGRAQLERWLTEPSEGWSLHHEPLLRVHLAPFGRRDDLIAVLSRAQADAVAMIRTAIVIGMEFAEERHQFQDQVHVRAILFDYLWNFGVMTHAWAERSLERVRRWPGMELDADAEREALALIRDALASSPIPAPEDAAIQPPVPPGRRSAR